MDVLSHGGSLGVVSDTTIRLLIGMSGPRRHQDKLVLIRERAEAGGKPSDDVFRDDTKKSGSPVIDSASLCQSA